MKTETKSFSFSIPENSPLYNLEDLNKNRIERDFEFQICETQEEAIAVITEKKWSIVDLVNDVLKSNARSNAYQTALIKYKPSEVPKEDIKERMVRDFMRLGVAEDAARKQVESLLAVTSNSGNSEKPVNPVDSVNTTEPTTPIQ